MADGSRARSLGIEGKSVLKASLAVALACSLAALLGAYQLSEQQHSGRDIIAIPEYASPALMGSSAFLGMSLLRQPRRWLLSLLGFFLLIIAGIFLEIVFALLWGIEPGLTKPGFEFAPALVLSVGVGCAVLWRRQGAFWLGLSAGLNAALATLGMSWFAETFLEARFWDLPFRPVVFYASFGPITGLMVGVVGVLLRQRQPGENRCLSCDYNLTGNQSGICPECGTQIDKGDS